MDRLTTEQAVKRVLATGITKYALAKKLGLVSSTSINQYLRGTRMSWKTAMQFELNFEVEVIDAHSVPSPDSLSGSDGRNLA